MIPFLIQETTFGQLVRFLSRNKFFRYPEEDPNFKIPWENVDVAEKEKELEKDGLPSNHSSDHTTPVPSPAAIEKQDPVDVRRPDTEAGLTTIATAASSARRDFNLVTTRTKTREQTTQYTAERFDIEQQEAIDRTQSSIIQPQKTADGITLVDWYTTDDACNPQNWNSWTKAWVAFHIFAYTFVVYCASAIYTPAEPQVMEKFGVGQAKASLGLSMYVIGYGMGPLVSANGLCRAHANGGRSSHLSLKYLFSAGTSPTLQHLHSSSSSPFRPLSPTATHRSWSCVFSPASLAPLASPLAAPPWATCTVYSSFRMPSQPGWPPTSALQLWVRYSPASPSPPKTGVGHCGKSFGCLGLSSSSCSSSCQRLLQPTSSFAVPNAYVSSLGTPI